MKSHEITRKIKKSAIWADFNDLDHNTNMTHVLNGGGKHFYPIMLQIKQYGYFFYF